MVGSLSWADETALFPVRPTRELFQRHLAVGNWRKPAVKSFKILFGCEQCRRYCLTRSSPRTPSHSVDVIDCGDLRTGSYCLWWFEDRIILPVVISGQDHPPGPHHAEWEEADPAASESSHPVSPGVEWAAHPDEEAENWYTFSCDFVSLSACLSHSLCVSRISLSLGLCLSVSCSLLPPQPFSCLPNPSLGQVAWDACEHKLFFNNCTVLMIWSKIWSN